MEYPTTVTLRNGNSTSSGHFVLQILMDEDNLRQAEHYFLEAGDWKQCINMYRSKDMYDEAYRVSFDATISVTSDD